MIADLLITNATVHTVDENHPVAEAVAIFRDRIVAVGTSAELSGLAGARTRIINAQKRLVLPGFNDAHVHMLMGGFQLSCVNLRPAKSAEEFARLIGDFAARLPEGQWILGGEWDHENWIGAPLPDRQMIDHFTPRHPVFISRTDGHMALANSLALRLAGVTKTTSDIPGGLIVRDLKTGEPTGLLKETAMTLVERIIPPYSHHQKQKAARAATDYAATLGVTSVQDMSTGSDVAVFQSLLDAGELKTRIYGMAPLSQWEKWNAVGLRAHFGSSLLRVGGLKAFSDGSLGSSTALFFEPYSDQSDNHGLPGPDMIPEGIMLKRILESDRAGFQNIVHAIGDRANFEMLEIFKETARQNGPRDRRFRIEHAQHLRPGEIPRFAVQQVIASMQLYHCIDDARWCEGRLGVERCQHAYATRSLLDSGATLAFGSDWTVAPLDPLTGIFASVTRQPLNSDSPNGWHPEQRLTMGETIHAYTMGSAFAEFQELEKGSLTVGKLADLVLLDQNLFTIDPSEILKTKVQLTVMNGRILHDAL